jgi:hypothetical protein
MPIVRNTGLTSRVCRLICNECGAGFVTRRASVGHVCVPRAADYRTRRRNTVSVAEDITCEDPLENDWVPAGAVYRPHIRRSPRRRR